MVVSRGDQFELNTLKLSSDTKAVIRKPYVWERPGSRLYDYHYEIGGLYYQPMIKYIVGKGNSGARRTVDIPDRMLSNFDRRAYAVKSEDLNLEDFLTDAYQRKTKDINKRLVRVENEKIRRSKRNTDLNMMRGAACIRDRYLCQLQLLHTGQSSHLPKEDISEQNEKDEDMSYGPGFEKIRILGPGTREPHYNEYSKVLEDRVEEAASQLYEFKNQNRLTRYSQSLHDALERTVDAKEFSKLKEGEEDGVDLKHQATYIGASQVVKNRLDMAKKEIEGVRMNAKEVNLAFRGTAIDRVGMHERTRLKADRFKPRTLPDIEDGYEKAAFREPFGTKEQSNSVETIHKNVQVSEKTISIKC